MSPVDIIVLIVALAIVGGFVGISIWRKKTGKSKGCGCGCDCGDCAGCPQVKNDKSK